MSEEAVSQEILKPKVEIKSPKDKIKEWANSLRALVSRNPSNVIHAIAHPNVLLPETPPAQEDQSISSATEDTLPNASVSQPDQEAVALQEQGETTVANVAPETPPSNSVEDFDLLGRAEAAESGTPVLISNSLDCFPDSLRIYNTDQGSAVADWWKLIKNSSSRLEISVWRLPNGDIKINFDLPREDFVREENGVLFDSRFATISTRLQEIESAWKGPLFVEDSPPEGSSPPTGEDTTFSEDQHETVEVTETQLKTDASSSGWKIVKFNDCDDRDWLADIPDQDDNHVVRGMSDAELIASFKTGVIQSRGDVVSDLGLKSEKGSWTFFYPGSNIEGALSYARGRLFDIATFSKPGYVISMKRTENIKAGLGSLHSTEPLPINDIERIYEIRPISVDGDFSISVHRYENPHSGTVYALSNIHSEEFDYPKIVYAFKEVHPDEVRKSLKIDKEPDTLDS